MELTILEYISPSRIGGAETYFLRLIEGLRSFGHRVLIVTKQNTPLLAKLQKRHFELFTWKNHGKINPYSVHRLNSLVREYNVDIINTHLTTASFIGSIAGRVTGVPVIARVPATNHKTFYKYADHLIAVSNGVKSHLIAQGIQDEKVKVLYNGINLVHYQTRLSSHEAKTRLGLPPHIRTIGTVASLTPRKGHRFLLQSLQEINSGWGEVHAVFAGEGAEESNLRKIADSLGLTDKVHFLGFRDDIQQVISAFDLFVLPSLKEGLSNAVMEAMALECPVISTAVAGMSELVIDNLTGLLVPAKDTHGLTSAILKILDDPDRTRQMVLAAKQHLENEFDERACMIKVEQFFQDVAANHKRTSAI